VRLEGLSPPSSTSDGAGTGTSLGFVLSGIAGGSLATAVSRGLSPREAGLPARGVSGMTSLGLFIFSNRALREDTGLCEQPSARAYHGSLGWHSQ
jgi:hypothetical protein